MIGRGKASITLLRHGLVNTISVLAVVHVVDGTGLNMSAHVVTRPWRLVVNHVGTEVGIEPSLVGLKLGRNALHRQRVDVVHFVE